MKHSLSFKRFILAILFIGMNTVFAEDNNDKFSRQLLFSKATSLPSKDIKSEVIRVVFTPGYKSPLHTHEGPGPRYIISGKVRVEDSGETHIYKAGEVFWETGSAMTIENVGSDKAELLIFQLTPAKESK